MDQTLIKTKSGNTFAENAQDWEWLYPEVPTKLQSFYNGGYKIVIFSNQMGIGKEASGSDSLISKINDIANKLGIPIQGFFATAEDYYRKPNAAMWELFTESYNNNIPVDYYYSVYAGDAAGRPGDFSCSDRKFAINSKIEFHTPEEIFLSQPKDDKFDWMSTFDPRTVKPAGELFTPKTPPLVVPHQEMIILIGPPGSGKSTFCSKYLIPYGYEWVNQDTLKTREKCQEVAEQAISMGRSVVVDNNNYKLENRTGFINIAKKFNVRSRCFHFQTSIEMAKHMNIVREKKTKGAQARIPEIAYRTYKSSFTEPELAEGYEEIKIN